MGFEDGGEPSDVDIADRRYLVEDARRAVLSLQHQGLTCFASASTSAAIPI